MEKAIKLAKANNNGTHYYNYGVQKLLQQIQDVVDLENIQKDKKKLPADLDYEDNNVYWKINYEIFKT